MSSSSQGLSKRDRALAELVRVRGWADDASIERAVAEASRAEGAPDLGSVLIAGGVITPEQLQALSDAIDGKSRASASPRPGTRAPSASADKTMARSDPGATKVHASGVRKPPDQIGPYRVLRELGRGGMGVVYRALDPELRREVALKVMIAGARAADSDVERFRREAAVVAKMGRHPNLVQIHDIGRDGDRLYFTMDFIEGRSAKQRVEEEGAFPPREAARIAAETAGALAFAHKAGVVHRDVKPHNILLDRDGKAFLGDFGLAKDTASQNVGLTESGSAFGTPAYMPPEQAGGHASQATALSDVYSLGATLFEMLTGRPPFVGETGMDIVRQVLDSDPPAPRTLKDGIHRDLEIICLKALRKEPPRRYASAAEMEADLRRFLNGEPIQARPAGSIERLVLKVKRHRAVVAVATVGLVLAAGIAGAATWRIHVREKQDEDRKADLKRRENDATPFRLDGQSLVERADAAAKSGGWKERASYARQAVEKLEEAKKILPESDDVFLWLGRALRRAERPEEALRSLEEAARLNPKNANAWLEHGAICRERLSRSRGTLLRFNAGSNEAGAPSGGFSGSAVAWAGGTGQPVDEAKLQETAASDFRKAIEAGAGAADAAYLEGMLLLFENRFEEALDKVGRAIAGNENFSAAYEARAEILEASKKDAAAGLADRRKLNEIEPYNPKFGLEYALSLRAAGRAKDGLEAARKAAERVDGNPGLALRASQVLLACGDFDAAAKLAQKALDGGGDANRAEAARVLVDALAAADRFEDAAIALEDRKDLVDPAWAGGFLGEIWFSRHKVPESLKHLRAVPAGSIPEPVVLPFRMAVEAGAGNLEAAEALARSAEPAGAFRTDAGLVAMERGDLKAAAAGFERVRKEFPKFSANLANLSAARFLLRDYAGAADALEESVTVTPLPKAQREAVKKAFESLRKRLPEPGALEDMAGTLTHALAEMPDAAQGPVREALRAVLRVLQQTYADGGMWKESIGAANRSLAVTRTGAMAYRLAQAKAKSGDAAGAIAALKEAQGMGFDEGERLDADAAFEGVKGMPEFGEVRRKCR